MQEARVRQGRARGDAAAAHLVDQGARDEAGRHDRHVGQGVLEPGDEALGERGGRRSGTGIERRRVEPLPSQAGAERAAGPPCWPPGERPAAGWALTVVKKEPTARWRKGERPNCTWPRALRTRPPKP